MSDVGWAALQSFASRFGAPAPTSRDLANPTTYNTLTWALGPNWPDLIPVANDLNAALSPYMADVPQPNDVAAVQVAVGVSPDKRLGKVTWGKITARAGANWWASPFATVAASLTAVPAAPTAAPPAPSVPVTIFMPRPKVQPPPVLVPMPPPTPVTPGPPAPPVVRAALPAWALPVGIAAIAAAAILLGRRKRRNPRRRRRYARR